MNGPPGIHEAMKSKLLSGNTKIFIQCVDICSAGGKGMIKIVRFYA
jgi:hypothetical protein